MTDIHKEQTTCTPNGSSPLGGTRGGLKVGILGAAGYTGGELIRLLLNHPDVEIVFANSESNAGNLFSDVHEGLLGETEQCFTAEMPFDKVDVVFFCFGHGKSEAFLKEHSIPANVKIIDLAQDFRIRKDKVKVNSEKSAAADAPNAVANSSLITFHSSHFCVPLQTESD